MRGYARRVRVLVTGGTGFVGSHSVAALQAGGHDVRLLVRSPAKVAAAFAPHGPAPTDVVAGDVTDRDSVRAALAGCEAVLHAANVFTFDDRQVGTMRRVNEQGTEIVLGEAAASGCDPILHVSSFVALLPATGTVTGDSPVGDPDPPYSASKAAAERVARRLQAEGAPVVTTYPGSVWGPHDPYVGESARLAIAALRNQMRVLNDGLLAVSDVRDVAAAHSAVMEPSRGPRRYLLVGHDAPFRAAIALVGEVTGRNLWSMPVPHAAALATGRAADWARRRFGLELPLSAEPIWLVANGAPTDASKARTELGIRFRPLRDTVSDTIRWLADAGHVTPRQAGKLAV